MVQLSLNGWPPIASHLAFLILGIGIANLSKGPIPYIDKKFQRSVIIPVSSRKISTGVEVKSGTFLSLVKLNKKSITPHCKHTSMIQLIQKKPFWAIKIDKNKASEIISLLKDASTKLVDKEIPSRLKTCKSSIRVFYGHSRH